MTTITDPFTRGNETPMASPWVTEDGNAFDLISNAATPNALAADCAAIYSGGGTTWGNDQSSKGKLTVNNTGGGGSGIGLYVRHATGAKTGYRFITDHAASSNCELAKFVAGAFTSLRVFTQAWTDGDTWELRAIGTTLSFWLNGTQVSTNLTDASLASGAPGLATSGPITSGSVDDVTLTDDLGQPAPRSFNAIPFIGGGL